MEDVVEVQVVQAEAELEEKLAGVVFRETTASPDTVQHGGILLVCLQDDNVTVPLLDVNYPLLEKGGREGGGNRINTTLTTE